MTVFFQPQSQVALAMVVFALSAAADHILGQIAAAGQFLVAGILCAALVRRDKSDAGPPKGALAALFIVGKVLVSLFVCLIFCL